MNFKKIARSILIFLHLDLTKNLEYDRLTKKVMRKLIKNNSNCIDVGCHKGEILEDILKLSPNGTHYAFEPIPYLFEYLTAKFNKKATILPYALANQNGESSFQWVNNAPAYSGIRKRKYNIANPEITEIAVELKKLDDIIPLDLEIDFIKIDVEGAEFGVLKGAKEVLKKWKPAIIFEFGLGASNYYETHPSDLYNFLIQEINLEIFTLKSFLKNTSALSLSDFEKVYKNNDEYYFIACNNRVLNN